MGKAVVTKNQPSITEWFSEIGELKDANAFREEDNQKSARLEILYQTIGLDYERPEKFEAAELYDINSKFAKILEERGDELCAIRLVPKKDDLPKLRNRGLSIKDCYYDWFLKQEINPADYTAHLCPHSGTLLWSATFVVNGEAIFGEIIRGLHSQLTHGETETELCQFRYDFRDWQFSTDDKKVCELTKKIIDRIKVDDPKKQEELALSLDAKFSHEYLTGYFEITIWPDNKIRYIDFNRLLPNYIPTPPPLAGLSAKRDNEIQGVAASAGFAKGKVAIIGEENLDAADFSVGAILICDNTDVRYLPFMRKAAAIVTNRGGLLSHPAIISRELKKPCIVDTKIATKVLKDGDRVEVDANKGIVRKIK